MRGTCPYVLFFGLIVFCSLLLQCFVPFIQKLAMLGYNGNVAFITSLININFSLPMETISNLWAAISATYVGLDRAAFTVDALRTGQESAAFDEEKMIQLTQILWMSFGIYVSAVLLYTFFDADLSLTPLFVSFGATVLSYVAGNKAVRAFQAMKKEDTTQRILLDGLTEEQILTVNKFTKIISENDEASFRIKDGKVIVQKMI